METAVEMRVSDSDSNSEFEGADAVERERGIDVGIERECRRRGVILRIAINLG